MFVSLSALHRQVEAPRFELCKCHPFPTPTRQRRSYPHSELWIGNINWVLSFGETSFGQASRHCSASLQCVRVCGSLTAVLPGLPIWWKAGVLVLGQASWFILLLGHHVVRADLVIVSLEGIPETSLAEIWGRHNLVSLYIGRYLFPLNSFVEMRNECPFCNHCQDHWRECINIGNFQDWSKL